MTEERAYTPTRRDESFASELHGERIPDPYRWLEDGGSAETRAWVEAQNTRTFAHLGTIPERPSIRRRLAEIWSEPRRGAPWRRGPWWFEMRHDGVENQAVLWVGAAGPEGAPPDAPRHASTEPDSHAPRDSHASPDAKTEPGANAASPDAHASPDAKAEPDAPPGAKAEPDANSDAERFRPLLDVNPLSADGTVSLTQLALTFDGARIAYALSEAGSDWVTWRVREVATGADLPDVVRWSKFTSADWLPSGDAFLYAWYDPPTPGTEFESASLSPKLRLHRLGTPQEEDPVVHEEPDHPDWTFDPTITHDQRWLVISVWEGSVDSNRILVAPIEASRIGSLRTLVADTGAHLRFLGAAGRSLVFLTDHSAPNGRIVAIDPDQIESCAWKVLVPETANRIEDARILGGATAADDGWILVHRWKDATSHLSYVSIVWDRSASAQGALDADAMGRISPVTIPLPRELASVLQLTGDRVDGRFHLGLETFLAPITIHSGDLSSAGNGNAAPKLRTSVLAKGTRYVPVDPAPVTEPVLVDRVPPVAEQGFVDRAPVTEQVFVDRVPPVAEPVFVDRAPEPVFVDRALVTEQVFVDHDGVRIPVFLLHREDVRATGEVPTILYGYGGFDVSITPYYSVPWRVWVERGGLVAVACLRGGGEYGQAWHDAGKTPHKENVFADAIAVAGWLSRTWTSAKHLGIMGSSNGGLLVGACMTKRPDLFGACVAEVGVMDMLRFHLFTIGWAWAGDYGSAEDPAQFRELLAYSPLHNLREGTCYPPTLLTTGDHDDRVVPGHSYKFAARLQEVQGCDHPVLLRVDVAAGHGAGKPLSKQIDERADVLSFLAYHLARM